MENQKVFRFLSFCIHSLTNKYGRVYAGALLVNTFGGIKTQITLHMLIIGEIFQALIGQVHALLSYAFFTKMILEYNQQSIQVRKTKKAFQ